MMSIRRTGGLVLAAILGSATIAQAHRPIFSDNTAGSAESAIRIDDPTISQVVYHEVTAPTEQLWLTLVAEAGETNMLQLGIPVIESLRDFRPAVALVGPGLPAADVPFNLPEGAGALVFTTDDVAEPEFFAEEFTGTDSWILGEFDVTFPATGRYFVVAYVPAEVTGKLWVAVGDREVFGLEDILSFTSILSRVRTFHEVPAAGVPCFLPVLAVGAGLAGGLHLMRRQRRGMHRSSP